MSHHFRILTLVAVLLISIVFAVDSAKAAITFDCTSATDVSQAECNALVALYNSTSGDSWTNKTNWGTSTAVCDWYGVTCTSNMVTALDLGYNQLSGSIPAEIGALTSLQELWLHYNQLSGSIPAEIGNLTSLQVLALYGNQLSGSIPAEIGNLTSLLDLSLDSNGLSGSIPAEVGNLTSLLYLYLDSNQLSGSIPAEIDNLTSLAILDLEGNQLSGSIPVEIGNLTSLQELRLHGNGLSGSIPAEIGNLTSLLYLDLGYNQLSGSIPVEIGNLTSLAILDLEGNQLSGSIPVGIDNLTRLQDLYLSSNKLTSVPDTFVNLFSLTSLNVAYNALPISGINPTLETFLNNQNSGWQNTQTVPPTDFQIADTTANSVTLNWTPVNPAYGTGYHEVGVSTTSGGPYIFDVVNRTVDKSATSLTVNGLNSATTYYFVVRTFTQGQVDLNPDTSSINSTAVSETTLNTAPVANDDAATVAEGSSIIITVLSNDSDADGDALTVTVSTMPVNGTAVVNADKTITYTHNSSETSNDSFVYTVDDGKGGTDTATVTITVTPPPVTSVELITNGGFEGDKVAGIPLAWSGVNTKLPGKDKQKCDKPELDKYVAYNGDCAFMFKGNPTGERTKLNQKFQDLSPFTDDADVNFSVYVDKRSAKIGHPFGKLIVKYQNGDKDKRILRIPDADSYTLVSDSLTINLNGSSLDVVKVSFRNRLTSGKFFIDDASLTVTPATLMLSETRSEDVLPLPGAPIDFRDN